jgi:hypothetical protein
LKKFKGLIRSVATYKNDLEGLGGSSAHGSSKKRFAPSM